MVVFLHNIYSIIMITMMIMKNQQMTLMMMFIVMMMTRIETKITITLPIFKL